MAEKPTPGGSDGTYGTELNAFLDVSLASDGKVKDGAVFSSSTAPSVDAGVANKKYVDDQMQSSVVDITSDLSNTSGSAADITGATKTITTLGGNVLLTFSFTLRMTAGEGQIWFDLNGTRTGPIFGHKLTTNASPITISTLVTSISATSHTFKVRWQDVSGDLFLDGTNFAAQLIVIELPN